MRTFMLAVTGLVFAVAACSSYGTSVVETGNTKTPVASVSLTIPSSLAAGRTARAIATPKDANGTPLTGRPITWYTSSASVAAVNDSGMISAVAPGTAVVSAVSEGVSGQASMAVTPPAPAPVATVSVAVSPPAVLVGQIAHATATLQDSSGNLLSGRVVTWASSNTAVATVQSTGDIAAVGAGTTTISATSEGKTNSAPLSVSAPAPIPVASVSVSPPSGTLQIGGTLQLSATTRDANGNVLTGRVVGWNSANSSIATVSSSGLVRAVAAGTVSITAASEGQTATASITVSPPPVATVSVSPAAPSIQTGATVQLSATTRDANNNVLTGRVVTWSSSNSGIASVNSSGLVTAVAAGSATITATSETKIGTSAITVTAPAPVPVATVSVSPSSSSLQTGATVQLSATTRDAGNNVLTGRVVTWSSANPSIASVNSSGLVTAVAAGSATITATSETKTGSAAITVTASAPVPVATVSVSPPSSSLQVGVTVQLSATTRDASNNVLTGRVVTWSSSSPLIASVNASGLVTVVAVGSATITATSETKTGTATVTGIVSTGAVWRGNEPASMTTITDQPFTSLPSSGWTPYFSWGLASDATAPHSPSSVFEIVYPAGYNGGNSPGLAEFAINPNYRQIYVCMYIKYSSNWQGHLTAVNKIIHFWIGNSNHLVIVGAGSGTDPLTARISLQGIAAGGNQDGGATGTYESPIQFVRGQWHMVEMVAVSNTGSNKDGSADIYVDGVHAAGVSGIEFEAGGPLFNLVKEDPTWGGGGDVVKNTQSFRVDHIYMSGK